MSEPRQSVPIVHNFIWHRLRDQPRVRGERYEGTWEYHYGYTHQPHVHPRCASDTEAPEFLHRMIAEHRARQPESWQVTDGGTTRTVTPHVDHVICQHVGDYLQWPRYTIYVNHYYEGEAQPHGGEVYTLEHDDIAPYLEAHQAHRAAIEDDIAPTLQHAHTHLFHHHHGDGPRGKAAHEVRAPRDPHRGPLPTPPSVV